jgi:hypothetical protein
MHQHFSEPKPKGMERFKNSRATPQVPTSPAQGKRRAWGEAKRVSLLALLLTTSGIPLFAAANPNSDCLVCHEDETLTKTNGQGKVNPLFIETKRFAASVHQSNTCVICHSDITAQHPDDNVPAKLASCVNCRPLPSGHEHAAGQYARSIHGFSREMGGTAAASCGDCHGSHYIKPVNSLDSPVFKLNLPFTCAKCHSNSGLTQACEIKNPLAAF